MESRNVNQENTLFKLMF